MSLLDIAFFIKQWGPLFFLSLIAAAVQMHTSKIPFTYFHYFMAVLVALLGAYLAAALCHWRNFDDDLTTGIIGITAYAAPHIFEGINKLFKHISQDPKAFLTNLLKLKS